MSSRNSGTKLDAQGLQELDVKLRLVQIRIAAREPYPTVTVPQLVPAATAPDPVGDSRSARRRPDAPPGEHMDYDVRLLLPEEVRLTAYVQGRHVVPAQTTVDVLAALSCCPRVVSRQEEDLRRRIIPLQDPQHRQRQQNVANVVGTADNDPICLHVQQGEGPYNVLLRMMGPVGAGPPGAGSIVTARASAPNTIPASVMGRRALRSTPTEKVPASTGDWPRIAHSW